ncbi:MAG: hypothetical protein QF745_11415, partial [Planctomycetota bacterium]|nr:hypothetical protein [Planctomycetota bacterium]
ASKQNPSKTLRCSTRLDRQKGALIYSGRLAKGALLYSTRLAQGSLALLWFCGEGGLALLYSTGFRGPHGPKPRKRKSFDLGIHPLD